MFHIIIYYAFKVKCYETFREDVYVKAITTQFTVKGDSKADECFAGMLLACNICMGFLPQLKDMKVMWL